MVEQGSTRRVIVITGASSGIGRGAALELAKSGAALAARRDELLDDLAGECDAAGGEAVAVPTDVSDPAEVEALAEASVARFGRIDVWINNAGSAAIGRFEEVPLADHIQVIKTDLVGAIAGSYVAMRQFRRQGAGTLISVSSVLGKMPAPYWASSAAAKFGIVDGE